MPDRTPNALEIFAHLISLLPFEVEVDAVVVATDQWLNARAVAHPGAGQRELMRDRLLRCYFDEGELRGYYDDLEVKIRGAGNLLALELEGRPMTARVMEIFIGDLARAGTFLCPIP